MKFRDLIEKALKKADALKTPTKKIKRRKCKNATHYQPVGRLNTPVCGNTNLKLKVTRSRCSDDITCKTCKKIIANWKQ